MKPNLLIIFFLTSFTFLLAEDFQPMEIKYTRETRAEVVDVKLLDSKLEITNTGNFENRDLVLTLGLTAIASACETMTDVKYVSGQSSLENSLNPSDHYFAVSTKWKEGCATGSSGKPQQLSIQLKHYTGQRKIGSTKPFFFPTGHAIHHYSFDAGMMAGLNRWALFKLDYRDLNNVKFEKIKIYSYVQGQVK